MKYDWGTRFPAKWHGNPVISILRSTAIAAGVTRLPVDNGGLPQTVAEMYLELVGLYGTPAPVSDDLEGTIRVMDPETIRLVDPLVESDLVAPATDRGSKMSTEEVTDLPSVSASVAPSQRTGYSNVTGLTRKLYKNIDQKRKAKSTDTFPTGRKRGFQMTDSVAESKESNDPAVIRTGPETRTAKRARQEAPEHSTLAEPKVRDKSCSQWID